MENTAGPSSPPTSARDRDIVGRRAGAFLVDNLMIFVLMLVVGFPVSSGLYALVPEDAGELLGLLVALGLITLVFGVFIGYYALFEGRTGQTPGKIAFGIEATQTDTGGVPGPKKSALRAVLLMFADGLFSGLVGLFVILASERSQRLGDMARTLVVRKR